MKAIRAATTTCAVAGLISTWDVCQAQTSPVIFNGVITPTTDLTAVYFLLSVGTCQPGGGVFSIKIADFLPADTSTPFSVTFNSIPDGLRQSGENDQFTIVGLYGSGVTLAYSDDQAQGLTASDPPPTWDGNWLPGYSNGHVDYGFNTTEAGLMAALQSGTNNGVSMNDAPAGPIDPSYSWLWTDASGPVTFSLVDYSAATAGGTASVIEATPEPGTCSLLATGAGLVSLGWLRRRKVG